MRKLMVSINVIKKIRKNTNLYKDVEYQIVYHENVSFEWHLESGIPAKRKRLLGYVVSRSKVFYNLSSKSQQIYSIVFLVLSTFKKILSQKTTEAVWKKNIMEKIKFNKYIRDIKILYNIYFTGLFCRLLTNR